MAPLDPALKPELVRILQTIMELSPGSTIYNHDVARNPSNGNRPLQILWDQHYVAGIPVRSNGNTLGMCAIAGVSVSARGLEFLKSLK